MASISSSLELSTREKLRPGSAPRYAGSTLSKCWAIGLNAYNNYQNGDIAGTILNGLGALGNLSQLSGACFAAGTPILTPDGSKPIEEIKPGDRVLLLLPDEDLT